MNINGDQRLPRRQDEKESRGLLSESTKSSTSVSSSNNNDSKLSKRKRKGSSCSDKGESDPLTKVSSMLLKSKSKYQNHYAPVIPLTPEEEAEWRREARRKRNRDSAAASRQKVRSKIQCLEQEVQEWKSKYDALFQKMTAMEHMFKSTMSSFSDPKKRARIAHHSQVLDTPRQQQQQQQQAVEEAPVVSPSQSPKLQPRPIHFIPETLSQGYENAVPLSSYHRDDVVSSRHINEVQSRQA